MKRLNLKGIKRGKLTFIEFSHIENKSTYWKCRCDCGNFITVKGAGKTKSCGCLALKARSINGKNNENKQSPIDFIKTRIKTNDKTGCWEWAASLLEGYARISDKRGS